jgi:hypothetical protein
MSTGLPLLNLMALLGYDGAVATQELFDWMWAPANDVVRAGVAIGRFLNDIPSYKVCTPPLNIHISLMIDELGTSLAEFDLITLFSVQLGKNKKDTDKYSLWL